jgi:Peptidoglycan-binding protein, CsiV
MIKKILPLLLVLMPLICWSQDDNAPVLHQVEIIIFENPINALDASEHYVESTLSPDLVNVVELSRFSSDEPLKPFSLLPATKMMLKREQWLLTRHDDYKILLHYAWLQPMDETKTIHIYSKDNDNLKQVYVEPNYDEDNKWRVNGTIRLNKTNYYNLNTDLVITTSVNGEPFHLSVKQSRRLRRDESHYLDHPLIGMLVKIHPLEIKSG